MADHEDYLPGEAPASHHASHEDGGTDELSIEGLAGESAELAIHAALPTVHQDAPDLILIHKGDASSHHSRYTDAEAVAAVEAGAVITTPYRLVSGESLTIGLYNQIMLEEQFIIEGTGTLNINGSGLFVISGAV